MHFNSKVRFAIFNILTQTTKQAVQRNTNPDAHLNHIWYIAKYAPDMVDMSGTYPTMIVPTGSDVGTQMARAERLIQQKGPG